MTKKPIKNKNPGRDPPRKTKNQIKRRKTREKRPQGTTPEAATDKPQDQKPSTGPARSLFYSIAHRTRRRQEDFIICKTLIIHTLTPHATAHKPRRGPRALHPHKLPRQPLQCQEEPHRAPQSQL